MRTLLEAAIRDGSRGDVHAQHVASEILEHGHFGLERNTRIAHRWLLMAAGNGHPPSQIKVGRRLLREGKEAEATQWLTAAAHAGCGEASLILYHMAARRSDERAHLHLLAAVATGYPPALNEFGIALAKGTNGVAASPQAAFSVFHSASCLGNANALYNLGTLLADGIGCEKNEAWATRCFVIAGSLGVVQAQVRMAKICAKVDPAATREWLRLAGRSSEYHRIDDTRPKKRKREDSDAESSGSVN